MSTESSKTKTETDKRSRIIEASINVFAEKGFHSSRVSDIAKGAGVADGTIYLYFRNKEDLLLCIFEEKMEDLIVDLRAALQGVEEPIDRIRVFAEQHFLQLERYPALAQVFQVELRQSHTFLREYRPERLWEYLNIFGEIVEEGQRRGVIRPQVDAFFTKWAFFGALDELSIQWVLARKRDRFNLKRASEQVVDLFINGARCN